MLFRINYKLLEESNALSWGIREGAIAKRQTASKNIVSASTQV
jgi:hypothetical protein